VISIAPSGRIWISRNQGLGELDPARLQKNTVKSIAHIQRLLVDGDSQDLHGPLRFPWNAKRIAVEYAGLNLSSPDQIRFRYRLDGYEQNWSAPVITRSADYTNLDPGPYRFRVSASNADQLWDSNSAELAFYVEPAVWQTWWFRTAVALLVGSIFAVIYTLRLKQITENASILFEARLAERTRIAREALSNAFRHANATQIEVDLRYAPRMLRLRVRDNGKGIDANVLNAGGRPGHWGLTGMEERARAIRTRLEIWSESSRGTEIELIAPASIAYITSERTLWSRFRR
jgi:anti-sigma regulatory factor (Ser/Thr protein kinase)